MFADFKYESVPLSSIELDTRNPRIVTQSPLTSQLDILEYLFTYEHLSDFIKKISTEGKNFGAERPYVVQSGASFVVIEGNTRIAAYKVLTGLLKASATYSAAVPAIPVSLKNALLTVDCSIAPSRDALLPLMASAHFGLGDKNKWGYLGSRKAVYDEWRGGKTFPQLAIAFDRTEGQIRELIIEYLLYLKAISYAWTDGEKAALLNPAVEFNPPVRFLQTSGHKQLVGITYDTANMQVLFKDQNAESKFKFLIEKLVVKPVKGLGATAGYEDVFKDYVAPESDASSPLDEHGKGEGGGTSGKSPEQGNPPPTPNPTPLKPKPDVLFSYPVTANSGLLIQLMKEAKDLSAKKYPAAATFLLRNILESLLKHVINDAKANPASKALDLEGCINLCLSGAASLDPEDKKILKDFKNNQLDYLNLGAHGNLIPSPPRVFAARDSIDVFIKKNI